jgi:phosphinothricin acetyltransferase
MDQFSMDLTLRTAQENDWPQIIAIYNQAIDQGGCTADTERVSLESRRDWLTQHTAPRYPILVAELNGVMVGWCSLSPYRPGRKALEKTAEISYYVASRYRSRGVASFLMAEAIKRARTDGHSGLIAILLDINTPSIKLLEKFGFHRWGHLPDIADFGTILCGHYLYGRKI